MRKCSRRVAGVATGIVLLSGVAVGVPAPAAADHKPRPPACSFSIAHRVDAERLLVGDDVQVEVAAATVCAYQEPPLQLVLVADDSRVLSRDQVVSARGVAEDLSARLFSYPPYPRVGAVGHGGASGCELQGSASLAERCVGQVFDDPRSGLPASGAAEALSEAVPKLRRDHLRHPDYWNNRQIVVLLAKPPEGRACNELIRASSAVKRHGALLVTVCLSKSCRTDCLNRVATSPRYSFDLDSVGTLYQLFDRIREDIINVQARRIDLTYPLAPDAAFVPGSLAWDTAGYSGAQGVFDETERVVRWSTTSVPPDGVTVTFGVKFTDPGAHVLGEHAGFTGIDSFRTPFSAAIDPRTVWANGLPPY